jgi:PKHD-type hydroxylase
MLLCIPEVLAADEVAGLRQALAGMPWATGQSAGPQAAQVKHNLQVPEDAPGLRELRVGVMRALNRSALLMSAALPLKVLPPNFNRYTPQHPSYGWHTDSSLRWLPDGSALRTDLSATLFLSPPEGYEGGELSIEDTHGRREVKLAAGDLVLYPSGAIHEVRPVTRGERLACYLFIQSVVPDTESRRQLYEMDQALRSLRARCGEADADLVRLTGLYNNLLRRWAVC